MKEELKIGDVVRSKNKNGQIQKPGTLVALIDPNFYLNTMLPKTSTAKSLNVVWGKTCPNWKNENIAFVEFNEPQRTATLKEWIESGVHQGFTKEQCEKEYLEQCPVVTKVSFPIADLEKSRVPFNIWDDFWDDETNKLQETHGYVEDDVYSEKEQQEICKIVLDYILTLDMTGVSISYDNRIYFRHLTHKRLNQLMKELKSSGLKYKNQEIYFYSES